MSDIDRMNLNISLEIVSELEDTETAKRLKEKFCADNAQMTLKYDIDGLSLMCDGQVLKGDFTHMLRRLKRGSLTGELLVKAAKIKNAEGPLTAVDATAGLGEDSLLLAAAGFNVKLYERNPAIYELLRDALKRASEIPELADIVSRMTLFNEDSIMAMKTFETSPDVILLDPMFPERQKSALVKKKLQMIQKMEIPCADEEELVMAAISASPKKLIIKRPPKGPYLAGIRPDYSLEGKAVRFDCISYPDKRKG